MNNGAFVEIDRDTVGGKVIHTVTNHLTGPGMGSSFSNQPLIQVKTGQSLRTFMYADDDKVRQFGLTSLSGSNVTDIGIGTGEASAPLGVAPVGIYTGGMLFLPYYNSTTGLGSVVAVEYDYTMDGDMTVDILDGTYTNPAPGYATANIRHVGAGNAGDFANGIATVIGSPTSLVHHPVLKTLFCATDAGMVYAWRTAGNLLSENATNKGTLHTHFPINVPGGRVTAITTMLAGPSATVQTALGVGSGTNVLGIFTDSGQILFCRMP